MNAGKLDDEARAHIADAGFNDTVRACATEAWRALAALLDEHGPIPDTLADIQPDLLATLASRLTRNDVETTLVMVATIRVVLLRAGHRVSSIEGLRVRTTRRRIANGPNGKYRFEKTLDTGPNLGGHEGG
ncbi:hypothetical protein GCM10027093_69790 [Paraburkholderia jirisanensis]